MVCRRSTTSKAFKRRGARAQEKAWLIMAVVEDSKERATAEVVRYCQVGTTISDGLNKNRSGMRRNVGNVDASRGRSIPSVARGRGSTSARSAMAGAMLVRMLVHTTTCGPLEAGGPRADALITARASYS